MSVRGPQQVLELAKVSRTSGEGATAVAALREVDLTISAGEFVGTVRFREILPPGAGNVNADITPSPKPAPL
jgi:predicted ABC-type transport system involved in lysophospholipase L1 biosynthesis ATPase subunit